MMRDFVYVRVARVASTSIYSIVGRDCAHEAPFPASYYQEYGSPVHAPAWYLRQRLGKKAWTETFTFGACRNPFDRVVSFFHHHYKDTTIPEIWLSEFKIWLFGLENDEIKTLMPSCWEMLSDGHQCIVNEVLQYENLQEEWEKKVVPHIPKPLDKHHHRSARRFDYRDYYDVACREYVAQLYKDDIRHWGYKFQ